MAADLAKFDGKRVSLRVDHGGTERLLVGRLRSFETEARFDIATGKELVAAETRWELLNPVEDRSHHLNSRGQEAYEPDLRTRRHEAVGIDPAAVIDISLK